MVGRYRKEVLRKLGFKQKGRSKYGATKVKIDGFTFDSKKEASRYSVLKDMQEKGLISNLQRQVEFELIPAQRESSTIGKKGAVKLGKTIERKCVYKADFCYTDERTGAYVVEDSKGFRTPEYKIKRKLMLFMKGIRIREV